MEQSDLSVQRPPDTGEMLYQLAAELYPICRSITGEGVRRSLKILQQYLPIEIKSIASGSTVYDWEVPAEWNARGATLIDPTGRVVADFNWHNLHLLNYSLPVNRQIGWEELKCHLFTLPAQPELIPYRTSYYQPQWGFCLPHNRYEQLPDGKYQVHIDTTVKQGHMHWGELYLPGESDEEVLFSAHICHPSLANDNLSGIVVALGLARFLSQQKRHYSYRFLFAPGTIGAIAWLATHEDVWPRIAAGLVLSSLGDQGPFHYKCSRAGNSLIDQICTYAISDKGLKTSILPFTPYGYDERQYCSPGINLPIGSLSRSVYGTYPEYHTSADNLDFISAKSLAESLALVMRIVVLLEDNDRFTNLYPMCEPQLGKRGLYDQAAGSFMTTEQRMAMLWLLSLSDGQHDLLTISRRSGIAFEEVSAAARRLQEKGLIARAD